MCILVKHNSTDIETQAEDIRSLDQSYKVVTQAEDIQKTNIHIVDYTSAYQTTTV